MRVFFNVHLLSEIKHLGELHTDQNSQMDCFRFQPSVMSGLLRSKTVLKFGFIISRFNVELGITFPPYNVVYASVIKMQA